MQRHHIDMHIRHVVLFGLVVCLLWQWSVGCGVEINCRTDSDCKAPARCALGQCKACVTDTDCRSKPGTRCHPTTFQCTTGVDAGTDGSVGNDNTSNPEVPPTERPNTKCKIGSSEACYGGPPNTRGKGKCRDGRRVCGRTGVWGPCIGDRKPTTEKCNKADDNCNGQVDEGSVCGKCTPGQREACYAGAAAERGVGACRDGTHTCTSARTWSTCTGSLTPTPEKCDGIDNNCNGKVDDKISTDPPPCNLQAGVCAGTIKTCQAGKWQPCSATTYKNKSALYQETETRCDGIDNDCDGQTDEDVKGCVTTLTGSKSGYKNAKGNGALFRNPRGIVFYEKTNTLFVADSGNNAIRKINLAPTTDTTTLAGDIAPGFADKTGPDARFTSPADITLYIDALFVADTANHRIRKIDQAGKVTTFSGLQGLPPAAGYLDGDATKAKFSSPQGIIADSTGNLYVADTNNHAIRKINAKGEVSTIAGDCTTTCKGGYVDGAPNKAQFNKPTRLAFTKDGKLLISDTGNHCIRVLDFKTNQVTTLAGKCKSFGATGGDRLSRARFYSPMGIVVIGTQVFIADRNNHRIRWINGNTVSTYSGNGIAATKNGTFNNARYRYPTGLTLDTKGNIYVTSDSTHLIRKLTRN